MDKAKATMSKTERARQELNLHHPIQDRGHAFKTLLRAGMVIAGSSPASARLFTAAVKQYEANHGIQLRKVTVEQRKSEKLENSRKAHTMDANAVRQHIEQLPEADGLFWACWALFKAGNWNGELSRNDFAKHFKRAD